MKIVADTVNGIPLNNSTFGWVLRPQSQPFTGLSREVIQAKSAGIDGHEPLVATRSAGYIQLVVNTAQEHLEALNALMARPSLTLTASGTAGRSAVGSLASSSIDRVFPGGQYIDMAYLIEIPDGVWRTSIANSTSQTLGTTTVHDGLFPGLNVEVQDAVVKIKGAFTGLQVTDSGGSWFTYDAAVGTGQWLRFNAGAGRAWITTEDTWTGGAEVSGELDFGGPRQVFEIAPYFSNPASREGRITIATATRSGASVQVRGRAAIVL